MKKIRIGLIGAGNIAFFHMRGYNSVREAYGDYEPEFVIVADLNRSAAEKIAERYNFKEITDNWKEVVEHPEVDAVIILTPNDLHAEMSIAAAQNGKHFVCEKPMAMTEAEGAAMMAAVRKNNVTSQVNFIYRKCPAVEQAKKIIDEGGIGEVVTFRGWFDSGYMADRNTPMMWRQYKKRAGTGALGDVTAHVISLSDFLVNTQLGGIDEVCAVWDTAYQERESMYDSSKRDKVDTDDQNYVLVRYKNGRVGTMYSSRISRGKDCKMGFEILGSEGYLKYDVSRINELEYYHEGSDKSLKGCKVLAPNTLHGDYKNYSIYDDMGVSYAEVMGIQAHTFLKAVDTGTSPDTDVEYGYYVDRVMDAIITSIDERRWVKIPE